MAITVDKAPGLFAQAIKLFESVESTATAIKALPKPLTAVSVLAALGIPAGTPVYVLGETVDLVVSDLKP